MVYTDSLDVVTFGEAMVLLVADEVGPLEDVQCFHKRSAGAETNVAIGLARLGMKVGWASRLGDDSMARFLLATLRGDGIDCSHVTCDPLHRTGLMFKGRVDDGSDPPVEYHRSGSAASGMAAQDVDAVWLRSARHLHATGVFPALSATTLDAARKSFDVMRSDAPGVERTNRARRTRRTISFDPNLRPALWASAEQMHAVVNEFAERADWVLPGLEEGRFLTGATTPEAVARHYRERGAALVIVKLGPDGAYYDGESGCGHVKGFPVPRVVDTVGAGDGFAVGVISALLEGLSVPEAVKRGAWIGARAVQVPGDTEGLPTRAELAAAGL